MLQHTSQSRSAFKYLTCREGDVCFHRACTFPCLFNSFLCCPGGAPVELCWQLNPRGTWHKILFLVMPLAAAGLPYGCTAGRKDSLGAQVRTASCSALNCVNTFGDEQLAVDVLADKLLFEALKYSVRASVFVAGVVARVTVNTPMLGKQAKSTLDVHGSAGSAPLDDRTACPIVGH